MLSRATTVSWIICVVSLCYNASAFGVEITRSDRLREPARQSPEDCLRYSDPKLSLSRFIINFCKKTVYVSVVEFNAEQGSRYCAVYGLLGNRYGKQYGPTEYYLSNSLEASFDVDRALENCKYSGYETTGDGFGEFMRIIAD